MKKKIQPPLPQDAQPPASVDREVHWLDLFEKNGAKLYSDPDGTGQLVEVLYAGPLFVSYRVTTSSGQVGHFVYSGAYEMKIKMPDEATD